MFGIGLPEMIVILVVALIVVGPDKLPELARSLAKGVNELRGVMNQVKESLNEETKSIALVKSDLQSAAGQAKNDLLDGFGGPRLTGNDDSLVEMEADLAESLAMRPWERDAAVGRLQRQQPAEMDSGSSGSAEEQAQAAPEPAAEERLVGKNPSSPAA